MVNNDTDTPCFLPPNTSFFKLSKGETTALTNFSVVADSLGTNSRTEEGKGADAESSCLGLASRASAELASRLVKPGADTALPVLAEMVAVEDCIR